MKYVWIKGHREQFPVAVMCRTLKVSTSGYYDSVKRKPCPQQIRRQSIAQAAAISYFESQRIYGHRKVYEDLLEGNRNRTTADPEYELVARYWFPRAIWRERAKARDRQ